MSREFSPAEVIAARWRFVQDQRDAEFVEFAQAMERIGTGRRRWRRAWRRLLRIRGLQLAADLNRQLDTHPW